MSKFRRRHKMGKRNSRKLFSSTARKVHRKNVRLAMRGGIRL